MQQKEIENIGQDGLLCGSFNSYLSLATFPRTLYYDRKTSQFFEIDRYDKKHNDKVYQPVYRCTMCDISSTRSILSYKSFSDTSQMINLSSFYQSTLYFTYIFITSLNQFLSQKIVSWTEANVFFQNLKHTAGYTEYLCWIDLFKSSSKDSLQNIRLKYFRPNQINFISVVFLENRGDLMEAIIRNIATYWYPRLCGYSGQLKEHTTHSWDYPELHKISKCALENYSVDEIRRILINVISYEELSGHMFQHFLLTNKYFEPSKYLAFIKGCLSFYDGFSHDTVDSQWAHRCAWKVISGYLMPGSKNYVYIPSALLNQVKNSSNPPYEDLFDGAIEYSLFILIPCLHRYFIQYIEVFDDISEESFVPSEATEDIADVDDVVPVHDVEPEIQQVPQIVEPEGSSSATTKSDDFLSDILRSRNEYERFKYFLTSLSPDKNDTTADQIVPSPITDLECYIDIEKFKIAKGKPPARDELATTIKQNYLTKKYFFGPTSPAPRNVQINILGGSGHTMPPRPSSPIIMEVRKYVLQRLINKWVKQYKATEDFQRRQNRGSALGRRRGNDNSQNFVFIDSKSRANAHDMLKLRKTLLDPSKSEPLKRYAKAKNERLLRDIEFWIEVQKYKDMHHRHSSTSLIRKKIDIIIDCFLDSTVFPKLQISIPQDVAHKITETRYDLGPYIFRQAQSIVTKGLCSLWSEYNSWCEKHTHQPLPFNKLELETQQKKLVKQLLRQKQRDDEKERAFVDLNKRTSTTSKRISRATSVATSVSSGSDTIRPTVEKIEEFMPTIHWKFSDTVETEIGEHEKRKQFLLKDILDKGLFKDDEGFREYLTDKIQPKKSTTTSQIFYNPMHQAFSKGTRRSSSLNTSFDSTGSSKSYKSVARVHSRSNFDRTQLVSISEKLTVPSRTLNRRTAVSLQRAPRPDSASASSLFSTASGLSGY